LLRVNRLALVAVLAIGHGGLAQPAPRLPDLRIAAQDARAELEACTNQAGALIGDVVVDRTWKATASKSLGASGRAIAECVRDALKKHARPEAPRRRPRPGMTVAPTPSALDSFTLRIGQPTQVLPPIATVMPVWRAAIAPHATVAERDAFAKLLPADYRIANQCIVTDRAYARDLEEAWLRGLTVITAWPHLVDQLVRSARGTRMASWDGTGLVTLSLDGLCAEAFDPVAARAVFDREGTCWAGSATDILLDPRVEFPNATYAQVSTEGGRTCAVTTAGAVTCCGRTDAVLGAAPSTLLRQIALGHDFACGLDAAGTATCWGSVKTAPSAPFTKLVAGHYRVCGIHRDGSVECWPKVSSPTGTFVDIALDSGACGIHTDGTLACWARSGGRDLDDDLAGNPPGHWQALAIGGSTVCGLRPDRSVGCTNQKRIDDGMAMATPVPQQWTQLALSRRFGACGLRLDGTIGCSDLQPSLLQPPGTPAPTGTFVQIAASGSQFCAVGSAGTISCWGEPWPSTNRSVATPPATGVHGRIVDEQGAPIAKATVAIAEARTVPPTVSTSAADGMWSSSTQQRMLWAKFTAPGREVVDLYGDHEAFSRPVVLRPVSTITVEASCDGRPCPATAELGHRVVAPALEVGPGTYRLLVWRERGTEHERLAIVEVEVPFAARPQVVRAALKETGSGHAIRGAVSTTTKRSIAGLRVDLRCANESERRAETDDLGSFELRNVPQLPCTLEVDGHRVTVDSYADVKVSLPR